MTSSPRAAPCSAGCAVILVALLLGHPVRADPAPDVQADDPVLVPAGAELRVPGQPPILVRGESYLLTREAMVDATVALALEAQLRADLERCRESAVAAARPDADDSWSRLAILVSALVGVGTAFVVGLAL